MSSTSGRFCICKANSPVKSCAMTVSLLHLETLPFAASFCLLPISPLSGTQSSQGSPWTHFPSLRFPLPVAAAGDSHNCSFFITRSFQGKELVKTGIQLKMSLLIVDGLDTMTFECPFQLKLYYDFWHSGKIWRWGRALSQPLLFIIE